MGNEPSNGIIKQGVKITKVCKECGKEFETYSDTVTIKGKTPEMTECRDCNEKLIKEAFEKMRKPSVIISK